MHKSSTCGEFAHDCTTQMETPTKVHASELNRLMADQFAERLRPVLLELAVRRKYKTCDLVRELNKHDVPTANGGKWHRTTIERLLIRLGEEFESERRAVYHTRLFGKMVGNSEIEKFAAAYKKSRQP